MLYLSPFTLYWYKHQLLFVGFTAILMGYLTVWLPGPAAGLSFLGVELGEWVKFLGVGWQRDFFYLPPITLGLMMVLVTGEWENGRFQTWLMRGLALLVSLLVFPAIEDITGPSYSEYTLRVVLIMLVLVTAVLSGLMTKIKPPPWLSWGFVVLLGLIGFFLPTWMYVVQIRPFVSQVLDFPVGIGVGVWLNGVGHGLVTAVSLLKIRDGRLENYPV